MRRNHESDGIVVTPKKGIAAPGKDSEELDLSFDSSADEPASQEKPPSSRVVLDLGTDEPSKGEVQCETMAADNPPGVPGIKAELTPPPAEAPKADDLSNVLYSLVFQPKSPIEIGVLAEALSKPLHQVPEGIEDRLRRRKGIVLRDLDLVEAVEIRDLAKTKGQALWVIAQTPDVEFGEAIEAERVRIGNAQLHWQVGPSQIQTPPANALLFSAAEVRIDRKSRRVGRVMSAFFSGPRQHLRLWESTHRYRDEPALADSSAEEAFRIMCLRLPDCCPEAKVTNSFQRLFGEDNSAKPLKFRSLAEFDDYNQYHLLSHYGRQVE